MSLYRIYIDEVGNHDMKVTTINNPNEQFLTLFGVIVERDQMFDVIQPQMNQIKRRFFQSDPDEQIVFHRKDISRMRGVFRPLSDRSVRKEFGNTMLDAYRRWKFTALTVTIDKKQHLMQYGEFHRPPYRYCLQVLMERYVMFLKRQKATGDAMIEARGKREDSQLATSYERFFLKGSNYVDSTFWQEHLTTKKLKINPKRDNIAGLQLADLLGHSAHYDMLMTHKYVLSMKSEYGQEVVKILRESKYDRSFEGQIDKYGMKLLP